MRPASSLVTALVLALSNLIVGAATHYVWQDSPDPQAPYPGWDSAAHTIQEALDAAQSGDTVVVTNGAYASGGRPASFYSLTNRAMVMPGVQVRSVNGPEVTMIVGQAAPGGGNADGAIRCAYLAPNTVLSGFTLTNGHTRGANGAYAYEQRAGGTWCEDSSATITNCIFLGNSAFGFGGGSYGGTLNDCKLIGNSALSYGGGSYYSILNNCTLSSNSAAWGGGVQSSKLNNCQLVSNSASSDGGGASGGTLINCTLRGNWASEYGGGAYSANMSNCIVSSNSAVEGGGIAYLNATNCMLIGNSASQRGGGAKYGLLMNCTLSGNSATNGGGAWGTYMHHCTVTGNSATSNCGGVSNCKLTNCIVYYNTAPTNENYSFPLDSLFYYSCSTPLSIFYEGNTSNAPGFVNRLGGNLRLQSNSPCINRGTNVTGAKTDLDGRPRIVSGTVDMGAYEFQGGGMGEFIGWLQQYGLPTDGSADSTDADHDGMTNWEEWAANTNPTNALSFFHIDPACFGPPGVVRFTGSPDRLYTLKFCTNLASANWLDVAGQVNVPGTGGLQSLTDTNAWPGCFYRVTVSLP